MIKVNNKRKSFVFLIIAFFSIMGCITACSLKYDEIVNAEESNPEFVFNHAKLVRYEKAQEKVVVQADNIEQYKDSSITYGRNVKFLTYDQNHKLETEGSCGYLYADTDAEIYELYDGIKLFSNVQNTNFYADMLKWNGKTEQMTGGRRDTAKLEKDGTVIYGTGFSASGISKSFTFAGTVSGEIETKDKNEGSEVEGQEEVQE